MNGGPRSTVPDPALQCRWGNCTYGVRRRASTTQTSGCRSARRREAALAEFLANHQSGTSASP